MLAIAMMSRDARFREGCAGECLKEPWSAREARVAGQADSISQQATFSTFSAKRND